VARNIAAVPADFHNELCRLLDFSPKRISIYPGVRIPERNLAVMFAICLFLLQPVFGAGEVGVDEKLGRSVPLELRFNDEDGQPVALQSLLGKTTILTLVYYECPGICTPLLNNLTDTLDRLDLTPGTDYQVITISFDEKDTPPVAAKKRANYLKQFHKPFPPEAWRFLTGNQAAIDQITEAVGFRYKKVGNDFNHPGVVMVLSPDGRMMRYLQGIQFLPFDIKMAVIEASKGKPMPTVNRVLAFCFSYDPDGRRYVFSTLKVAGVATLAVIACFGGFLYLTTRKRK
jgi:protein SCO1/2